ncbi:Alpha/beta hydrolase family protein [Humidesulfovibrio mexicanus]|jgi:pimeloyl-ACP methyl ester carboxylesterase|uniref:Alpha/beta hydrolase family protein n=1 Tax=Humidesulfovibrio mexicanus TaxID=147047 RepID=A0A239C0H2_9BACT|nr:alpha/beta fold hydrolase [Humidesulfovibrio mexicanus]SNS12894.1 Alpha/beta hydrolase family protein [Humidesulfovibrio mexicanus]
MLLETMAVVAVGVPALPAALAWLENRRSGDWLLQRRLCGGRLASALLRAFLDSVWTLWCTALALPFGRLCSGHGLATGTGPAVILVHGLYHNPAAWFVLRRRLARAGFADVRCYGYPSFGRPFGDIVSGLEELVRRAALEVPDGRVALVGHSLGGLVIRAACGPLAQADAGHGVRIAGVATLGAPHRGSVLAARLGVGRLARGLAPGGEVLEAVRGLPPCPGPALSLYTPTDCMVQPLSGALLEGRELSAGWTERAVPPVSHVGLLYSARVHAEVLAFLTSLR